MKKLVIILIAVTALTGLSARTVVDMAGRKVNIPDRVTRILPHDDKTAIFLYPSFAGKIIGRGGNLEQRSMKYIAEDYKRLPVIDVKNTEEVIKAKPDIIIAGVFIPEEGINRYEKLSKQTNIPVIIINLNILKLDESYKFLTKIFGKEAQTKECIAYLNAFYTTLNNVKKSGVKNNASVYFAVGKGGLLTAPKGSKHAQVFDLLGIRNVADVEVEAKGYAQVSPEQVMVWKPDYIFTVDKGGDDPFTEIQKSPTWQGIPAVKNKQLIHVPEEPYNWFGNPPSINRIPGLYLLMELFYQYPKAKARAQIREFYRVFYHYNLTETELMRIMANRA